MVNIDNILDKERGVINPKSLELLFTIKGHGGLDNLYERALADKK